MLEEQLDELKRPRQPNNDLGVARQWLEEAWLYIRIIGTFQPKEESLQTNLWNQLMKCLSQAQWYEDKAANPKGEPPSHRLRKLDLS